MLFCPTWDDVFLVTISNKSVLGESTSLSLLHTVVSLSPCAFLGASWSLECNVRFKTWLQGSTTTTPTKKKKTKWTACFHFHRRDANWLQLVFVLWWWNELGKFHNKLACDNGWCWSGRLRRRRLPLNFRVCVLAHEKEKKNSFSVISERWEVHSQDGGAPSENIVGVKLQNVVAVWIDDGSGWKRSHFYSPWLLLYLCILVGLFCPLQFVFCLSVNVKHSQLPCVWNVLALCAACGSKICLIGR